MHVEDANEGASEFISRLFRFRRFSFIGSRKKKRKKEKEKNGLLSMHFSDNVRHTASRTHSRQQSNTRRHTQRRCLLNSTRVVTSSAHSCVRQSDWQTDEVTPSGPESEEEGRKGGGVRGDFPCYARYPTRLEYHRPLGPFFVNLAYPATRREVRGSRNESVERDTWRRDSC